MEYLYNHLNELLLTLKVSSYFADIVSHSLLFIGLLLIILLVDYIIRKTILATFSKIAAKSKTNFDDIMVVNNVPRNVAHLIPFIIAYKFIPSLFFDNILSPVAHFCSIGVSEKNADVSKLVTASQICAAAVFVLIVPVLFGSLLPELRVPSLITPSLVRRSAAGANGLCSRLLYW